MPAGHFNSYESVPSCLLCGSTSLSIVDSRASIRQCDMCAFKFVTPRPTHAAVQQYYNVTSNYDSWLAEREGRNALWTRRFSAVSRLIAHGSLLDVGAGIGTFLDIARKNGFTVQGTEVSKKAKEITKNLYGINLLPGSLEEQNFSERSFDVITIWHVLEHVPYPLKTLQECHRILKSGGYLIIAVPNDDSLVHWLCEIRGMHFYQPLEIVEEIHMAHFSSKTLNKMLAAAGFDEKQSTLDDHLPVHTLKSRAYYTACTVLKTITGRNYYSTILSISQKP